MAATSDCYEGIPLRFLASLFYIQMRYLVYMRYLWLDLVSDCITTSPSIQLYKLLRSNKKESNTSERGLLLTIASKPFALTLIEAPVCPCCFLLALTEKCFAGKLVWNDK